MIDASIALRGKPVEIENPVNQLAKMMQVQGMQTNQLMTAQKFQEAREGQLERNMLSGMIGDPKYMKDGRFDIGSATADIYRTAPRTGGAFIKELGEQQKTAAETGNSRAQMNAHELKYLHGLATQISANPTIETANAIFDQWEGITGKKVPVREAFMKATTPEEIRALALRVALNAEQQLPKFQSVNAGGKTVQQAVDPVTGMPTVTGSVEHTASPGELLASQDRRNALGQAERHFQAGLNTPEYRDTDAGLVALPKKLAPGQAPTGTQVTGPDGQPLRKALKAIPPNVNAAMIANSQSMGQIERALTLLGGSNIGNPKEGGQQGDKNATGWKGYVPNTVLNRLDPRGVDARAEISDIGSLKIHDRSGAAVTLSEAPRLMPFIPLATDDAATVKKKLARLRTELQNESLALEQTYSQDQGYKPSPIAGGGNGGSRPTPEGARPAGAGGNAPTVTNW